MTGESANAVAMVATCVVLGSGFAAYGFHRRDRLFQWLGVLGLLAAMLFAWRQGLDSSRWRVETALIGLAPGGLLAAAFCWADVVGLPWWLATRTGLGLRHPWLKFYSELALMRAGVAAAIEHAHSHPAEAGGAAAVADDFFTRLIALQPPTEAWAEYRDAVLAWGREGVTLLRRHANKADWQAHHGASLRLDSQIALLRPVLAAALRFDPASAPPRASRTFLVVGAAGFLVWFGFIWAAPVVHIDQTDPWLWLKLTIAAIGVALLLAALVRLSGLARRLVGRDDHRDERR